MAMSLILGANFHSLRTVCPLVLKLVSPPLRLSGTPCSDASRTWREVQEEVE